MLVGIALEFSVLKYYLLNTLNTTKKNNSLLKRERKILSEFNIFQIPKLFYNSLKPSNPPQTEQKTSK